MRRVFLVLAVVLLLAQLCVVSFANAELELKTGIGYSLVDSKINSLTTIELLSWKEDLLNLEAGYAGDGDSTDHKAILAITSNVLNLEKLGLNVKIAKYINCNIGFYVGFGRINFKDMGESEMDYGLSATLLTYKF